MAEVTEGKNGRSNERVLMGDRPAKRKEIKQAELTKKKEDARKANQLKNRERVQKGKALKADPGSVVPKTIWEKMAEDRVYYILREVGDTTQSIDKWQKKRVLMSLLIMALCAVGAFFFHVYLYIAAPIFGFAFYKMKAKNVETFYKAWKFERQLNFSKFTRLVIPYMKASGGSTALYTIFNKILKRTENESDKRSLYQLMGEMGDSPADLKPFTDYAQRSSGTDMSHLFMSTIFDFQQSTFDTQVIDELGKMAGEDMLNAIDEIIGMKLKRFAMFPTKVVMSSFILVVGIGGGLILDNFKDLDMGGGASPTAAIAEAESSSSGESPSGDDAAAVPADDASETEDVEAAPTDDAEAGSDGGGSTGATGSDWEAKVDEVVADQDADNAQKAQTVNDLANKYDPSQEDIVAFEESIKKEHDSGLYKEALTNDKYTLSNIFKSRAVMEFYKDIRDDPMYVAAYGYWENSYNMYAEGKSADDPDVKENDKLIQDALKRANAQ